MRRAFGRLLVSILVVLASLLSPVQPNLTPASAAIITDRAMYFPATLGGGGAYITVPRTSSLNDLTQITLEAWVKRVDASRTETMICNQYAFSYCLGFIGGQIFFTTNGSSSQVTSTGTVAANQWTHIAATYANGVSSIYINGILDTSASNPSGIGQPTMAGSIGIGADLSSGLTPISYFEGWMDNVRVWSVARNGSDIRAGMFLEQAGSGQSAGLVSEWALNGNAADNTGYNDGTANYTVNVTDGAIPNELSIPQVGTSPTLDGLCGDTTEYNSAVQVVASSTYPPGTYVYLERTATDLWVCFNNLTAPAWSGDNWAAVYLDPQYTRDALAQPTQLSLEVHNNGTLQVRAGDSAGGYTATSAYNGEWDGKYMVYNDGLLNHYSAEFRISNALLNATAATKVIGLSVAQEQIGGPGDNRLWPALATDASPVTWGGVVLDGTGPTRTFSGHVQYVPQGSQVTSPIPGVGVQLIGIALNNTRSIVATTTSLADGSFSLTSNDDNAYHQLVVDPNTFPQGFMPYSAAGYSPAVPLSDTVLTFGTAGAGTYGSNLFTMTDNRPALVDQSNAPYFLIIAPQATIAQGALDDFVAYKQRLGFQVEVESVEFAIANTSGGNPTEHIRALEINRLNTYGGRFGYVMLVGSDQTIPFGRLDAGALTKYDCLSNIGWPSDWVYADLTSNWDTNGNHCMGDGIFGDPSVQAKNGYVPDNGNLFNLTVAVGRIPFDNPDTVRSVLQNSISFEMAPSDLKRQALLSMSMMDLHGQCYDTNQGKYGPCYSGTDGAYLGQALSTKVLAPNGMGVYPMYENQPTQVGGVATGASGFVTTVQDTYDNLSGQLAKAFYGLVGIMGHGWSEGVVRTYWGGDANGNGLIDQPTAPFPPGNQPVDEVQQTDMFDNNSAPSRAPGQAPVFLIGACDTGEFNDPNSLGASLLSSGQGTAWIGGTETVPYSGGWQAPGGGGFQDINFQVANAMLNGNQRLGDALWDTMGVYMAYARQHPAQGWWAQDYDLYGDPTLSYWGNGGGQATLSPWPMLRADSYGHGMTGLVGPTAPTTAWTYPALARVLDQLPPSPVVTNHGDAVIAQNNTIDVVENGNLVTRLTMTAPAYGTPAIAADGTIYALDRGGKLYAFWCGGGSACNYTLHWSIDLGSYPLTSPVIGPDGLVAVGHAGDTTASSLIALVRSDGFLFHDQPIQGQAVSDLVVGGNRVIYATTDAGALLAYDYTCPFMICVRTEAFNGPAFTTPPLLYSNNLYAGRADGSVLMMSPVSLLALHTFQANGAVISGPIVAPGGSIVFGTDAGTLFALSNGMTLRWQVNLGASLASEPAASSTDVYIASGSLLYAFNPVSGTLDWQGFLGAGANGGSAAVGYGRQVFVQTRNGPLVDVAQQWSPPSPWLAANPTLKVNLAGGPPSKMISLAWASPFPVGIVLSPAATPLGYRIQRRLNNGPWEDLAFVPYGSLSYDDLLIQPDALYDYRIQLLDSQGHDSDFTLLSAPAASLPDAPGAPVLSPVVPQSSTSLALAWSPGSGGAAASFQIQRAPSPSGPFSRVASVTGATLSFTDTGLSPGTGYAYQVVAVNPSGQSAPSNVESGATWQQTLPAPTHVVATLLDKYHVQVSWDAGPAGAQAVIEVNPLGLVGFQLAGTASNLGPFVDTITDPNSYTFRVKFVMGSDESPYSAVTLRVNAAGFSPVFPRYVYLPEVVR